MDVSFKVPSVVTGSQKVEGSNLESNVSFCHLHQYFGI